MTTATKKRSHTSKVKQIKKAHATRKAKIDAANAEAASQSEAANQEFEQLLAELTEGAEGSDDADMDPDDMLDRDDDPSLN